MDNKVEDSMFQKLMERIIDFERTHEKVENVNKKELLDYYMLLYRVMADDEEILVDKSEERVVIKIQASEILFVNDDPALKQLISLADIMFVRPIEKGVEMELEFRLWDWEEKAKP